jgi:hypothetical protein
MLGRTRFVTVPVAIDDPHEGAATAGIHQLQAVKMIVRGTPIDLPRSQAGGALNRLGDIRTHVQLLFPEQRIGPQIR